jgi:hypothetical protein
VLEQGREIIGNDNVSIRRERDKDLFDSLSYLLPVEGKSGELNSVEKKELAGSLFKQEGEGGSKSIWHTTASFGWNNSFNSLPF